VAIVASACLVGAGSIGIVAGTAVRASADTIGPIDFESYSTGTVNGQDGWTSTGAAGMGCAVYDHAIVNNSSYPFAPASFGTKSLRISDAVTSGCFSDQTFSKPVINAAGEAGADAGGFPTGTLQPNYIGSFQFASVTPASEQVGLHMSVSPDRGDGARMSYVRIEDSPGGWNLFFDDYQDYAPLGSDGNLNDGCAGTDNFIETQIATGVSRGVHTLTFAMHLEPGPHNDVVSILLDGVVIHTGTSWEDYYRYCGESGGGNVGQPSGAGQCPASLSCGGPNAGLLPDKSRIVRDLLFRTSGTADPANAGNGFLIDGVKIATAPDCTTDCYVDTTAGNDAASGLSGDPLRTIQEGVDRVQTGGRVHVAAGTYNEEVTVGKSISLLGAQAGVDARTPRGAESIMTEGTGETPLILNASDVTVDGFTVEGQTQVNHFGAGVWMEPHTHGTQFVNNIVRNNVVGLFLTNDNGADPTLIQHDLFQDNTNPGAASGNDVYADNFTAGGAVTGATIDANKFTNSSFVEDAWAVDVSNGALPQFSNIVVSNNSIDNHGRGVVFFATTNSSVTANTFTPGAINHYGVLLCGDDPNCIPGIPNTNISITLNSLGCASCVGQGVEVIDANGTSSGLLINRNDLHGLPVGISNNAPSSVDGTCNWWGSATGPGVGQTSGAVTSTPWLTAASPLATAPCTGGLGSGGLPCAGIPGPLSAPLTPTAAAEAFPGAAVSWAPPLNGCPAGYVVTPYLNGVGQTPTITHGPGTTTVVGGLTAGAAYTFTVAAYDAHTVGPASVMTTAPVTIGAPAAAKALHVAKVGKGTVTIAFAAAANNGAPITKYTATCTSTDGGVTKAAAGKASPLKVTGLTTGKTYTCTVKATNKRGTGPASRPSAAVKA